MKKAAILKISPQVPDRIVRDKKYSYMAKASWHNIDGEDYLIIDIFRNLKKSFRNLKMRIVYSSSEYAFYSIETESWRNASCFNNMGSNYAVWNESRDDKETYIDSLSENYVWEFGKKIGRVSADRRYRSWTDMLVELERKIKTDRIARKNEIRASKLNFRMLNTPKQPDDLLQYADENLFLYKHFLYYKRKNNRVVIACSACGRVSERKIRTISTCFEDEMFTIPVPEHDHYGTCPDCKELGVYKAAGRCKGEYGVYNNFYVIQPYLKKGVVSRYYRAEKRFTLEWMDNNTMQSAHEEISLVELARTYMDGTNVPQTDFHKYDPYAGKDFWDDCNLSTYSNPIKLEAGKVYNKSFENLKGTAFQYCALKEYSLHSTKLKVTDYLSAYYYYPELEMMCKMKLWGMVEQMISHEYGTVIINSKATQIHDFFGIRKERLNLLTDSNGDMSLFRVLRLEKVYGKAFDNKSLWFIKNINPDTRKYMLAISHMSDRQFINRIEKYSKCSIPEDINDPACSHFIGHIRMITITYLDYLDMRDRRGYDLNNTIYQYPRNLNTAHAEMVKEINKEELDKRLREVAENYPNIQKQYRKLKAIFGYEDDEYIIRPAHSADEIVLEGRILHHCVGGNGYLEKHNNGESIILMLRFKESKDIPYITVEISPTDYTIKQWYGAYDKKPDESNMNRWINNYVTRLKCSTDMDILPISMIG